MRVLRMKDVQEMVQLSRTTIYRYIHEGRFPPPRHIGGTAKGWLDTEIAEWLSNCPPAHELVRPSRDAK